MKKSNPLILDTTFILPLFGVKIDLKRGFQQKMKDIWKNKIEGYQVYLPSVCLVESMVKLLSEYKKNNSFNILNRYQKILPTILDLPLELFLCESHPSASMFATTIRHAGHPDIMDCWIAGTAAALDGILLTEDKDLKSILKEIPETKEIVTWSWGDL
ncbi:MAG: type II toxin-antitoxin system VapC family toxin [Promethearchaeia archaeon]